LRIATVYLGDAIPDYFWANIQYLLSTQDQFSIDIITTEKLTQLPIKSNRLRNYVYSPELHISKLLRRLNLDFKFRDGFWQYSLERLFALTQYHQELGNESVLHIESDVLILPNFPFSEIVKLDKLAWSQVDATRDVASLIFFPTSATSRWLQSQMTRILQEVSVIDDMAILKRISSQFPLEIMNLPTANSMESEILNRDRAIELPFNLHSGFDKFGGIFDPGSIGIWLTGSEPRNHFGITRKFDSGELRKMRLFLDPGLVRYSVSERGHLTYRDGLMEIPIYSLHIHSKNISYFEKRNLVKIAEDVKLSRKERIKSNFSIQILLSLLWHNLRKGTLLRYLLWLPLLQRVKKRVRRTRYK
jgi:hypothetical protein